MTDHGFGSDPEADQLTRMLTDLAADPAAPPSTVTARSVLEAARAAAVDPADAVGSGSDVPELQVSSARDLATGTDAEPVPVGDIHVLAVRAEAARIKAGRRRTALFSLAAAAAVAAIAAVVIPLAISGNSTTTSANSAPEAPAVAGSAAAGSAAAAAPSVAPSRAAGGGAAPDSAQPSAGAGSSDDSAVNPSDAAEAAPATPSCWPALPDTASVALSAALPAGAFEGPGPLPADCGPDPVAGAALTGTAPRTALEVRVSKAESGACARGGSEVGPRCSPSGDGVYLKTDEAGRSTAYVYGDGDEVAVGPPEAAGAVPIGSGLTAEQTVAAAQAVLSALG